MARKEGVLLGRMTLIRPVVVNVKFDPCDVYIGRDMPRYGLRDCGLGNPFKLIHGEARGVTLRRYEAWARHNNKVIAWLPKLTGKRLGCWCRPQACHGDVLVKLWDEWAAWQV